MDDNEDQGQVAQALTALPTPASECLGHHRQGRDRRRHQTKESDNTDRHRHLPLQIQSTAGVEVLRKVCRSEDAEGKQRMNPRQEKPHQAAKLNNDQSQEFVIVVPVYDPANKIGTAHKHDGRH